MSAEQRGLGAGLGRVGGGIIGFRQSQAFASVLRRGRGTGGLTVGLTETDGGHESGVCSCYAVATGTEQCSAGLDILDHVVVINVPH